MGSPGLSLVFSCVREGDCEKVAKEMKLKPSPRRPDSDMQRTAVLCDDARPAMVTVPGESRASPGPASATPMPAAAMCKRQAGVAVTVSS